MRKQTIVVVALLVAAALPAAKYLIGRASGDELGELLKRYGYIPEVPPVTFITVGSLVYVDFDQRHLTSVCRAGPGDVSGVVAESPSPDLSGDISRSGNFNTGIGLNLRGLILIHANAESDYVAHVKYALSDIKIDEISIEQVKGAFTSLMNRPSCSASAHEYLNSNGYVCQVTGIFSATAEYKLDSITSQKLATASEDTLQAAKDAMKQAVDQRNSEASVVKEGRLFSGSGLQYGVTLAPICLTPDSSRFVRLLPHTTYGRYWNYFFYNFVDLAFPASGNPVQVPQDAQKKEMAGR